ncbi:hypothetical protein [Rhizobium sp. BE258]|uniref:hypothetical protein n=1 Tax=Rhizobium sp. BE258 TaxID=2817722 RepID=UPI002866BBB2|nr:hypothetical protein [Rhizobium sp. BE258]MDR7143273.1 hypothetical protein [Rhizobium sp. BE258]
MGASKRRKELFLLKHPLCFFCGSASETEDHVPSRECFINRVWPEGYVFPACKACNNKAGPLEQVAALYMKLGDHSGTTPSDQFLKLLSGVRNNNPEYLPRLDVTANAKKRALPLYNLSHPPDEPAASAPIAEMPNENRKAFEAFERRLTCALYYKHMKEVMPTTHMIRTFRTQVIARNSETLIRTIAPMFPNTIRTTRQNTNLGDQFTYVWYGSEDKQMFAFIAQFSQSYVFLGVACRSEDLEGGKDYRLHSDDL